MTTTSRIFWDTLDSEDEPPMGQAKIIFPPNIYDECVSASIIDETSSEGSENFEESSLMIYDSESPSDSDLDSIETDEDALFACPMDRSTTLWDYYYQYNLSVIPSYFFRILLVLMCFIVPLYNESQWEHERFNEAARANNKCCTLLGFNTTCDMGLIEPISPLSWFYENSYYSNDSFVISNNNLEKPMDFGLKKSSLYDKVLINRGSFGYNFQEDSSEIITIIADSKSCNNLPFNGLSIYIDPVNNIFSVSVLCKWFWFGSWHGQAPYENGKTCGFGEFISNIYFNSISGDFQITCSNKRGKKGRERLLTGVASIISIHKDNTGVYLKPIYKLVSDQDDQYILDSILMT
tara:strand:+ start:256 stop:1305 length:1050 start_codon:yes stop_codon:yes gene_type:complete